MNKLFVAVLFVGLSFGARAEEKAKAKANTNAVITPADDVKWNDVPNFPGVKMAAVEGDPAKGAHHAFHKFAAGFAAPMHHHSANHYGTVVSGTVVLTVDGVEHKLPAGSFFSFTNKTKHATKCEAGADCIISVDCRGKWDVIVEEAKGDKKT